MKFIDNILQHTEDFISDEEGVEVAKDFLGLIKDAVIGNPTAIIKVVRVLKGAYMLRESIFWKKMEKYLNGIYLSQDDVDVLKERLNGMGNDGAMRLISLIDKVDTEKKIQYIINVTRCLINNEIDSAMFFRICNIIQQSMDEDLRFLHDNIDNRGIPYGIEVQGLLSVGLMYQSVIDAGNIDGGQNSDQYSVTPLGKYVNAYAIDYRENEQRHILQEEDGDVTTRISGLEFATDDEVREMLDNILPIS